MTASAQPDPGRSQPWAPGPSVGPRRVLTPQQVDAAWRDSIVTDPESLPESYLQTLRERAARRLAERETRAAS